MLLGVPLRPQLPPIPLQGTDLEGIRRYLEQLDQAVFVYISEVLTGAVGLLGVRGISSSGTVAQNFLPGPLVPGVTTTSLLRLPRLEPDASYVLFLQPTAPASTVITSWTQMTSGVIFNFAAPPPPGSVVNVLLLR